MGLVTGVLVLVMAEALGKKLLEEVEVVGSGEVGALWREIFEVNVKLMGVFLDIARVTACEWYGWGGAGYWPC